MTPNHLVIDGLLTADEIIGANACWPPETWEGWISYAGTGRGDKRASDLSTPLPGFLAVLLARLAAFDLGGMLGTAGAVPDLSLCGAGLHAMPAGEGLPWHRDADTHPRLGLARAYSACLYVHPLWGERYGGELELCGPPDRVILPLPGRVVLFEAAVRHRVRPVTCPDGVERRSLALFGFFAREGVGERPRARFDHEGRAP